MRFVEWRLACKIADVFKIENLRSSIHVHRILQYFIT